MAAACVREGVRKRDLGVRALLEKELAFVVEDENAECSMEEALAVLQ